MRIHWTVRAKKSANEVGAYILQTFGERSFEKFCEELLHNVNLLAESPNLGRIEPLLNKRLFTYRSLVVNKRSKIIYRFDNENIFIVDLWDTRREPEKLVNGL